MTSEELNDFSVVYPQDTKLDLDLVIQAFLKRDFTRLYRALSGLDASEVARLQPAWNQLKSTDRRKLIRNMVTYCEADFELDYRSFALMTLRDTDPGVRSASIEVLWEDESLELLSLLHEMAQRDPDTDVRASAVIALGRFILLGEYEEVPSDEIAPVVDTVAAILQDNSESVELRRRALEAIANSSTEIVPIAIREFYTSDNVQMRTSAVFAMGRSCDNQWDDFVLDELDSPDSEIRYEAARASGELAIAEAVPKLGRLILEGDREILEVVVWSLGEIGGKEALRILNILAEQAEENEDDELVEAIDEAIGTASLMGGDGPFTLDLD